MFNIKISCIQLRRLILLTLILLLFAGIFYRHSFNIVLSCLVKILLHRTDFITYNTRQNKLSVANSESAERSHMLVYMKNYNHFMSENNNVSRPKDFSNFVVKQISLNCREIRLTITDERDRKSNSHAIKGGCTFDITVRGKHCLYTCPYVDNFDGTHNVTCLLYDIFLTISIKLQNLYFDAFRPGVTVLAHGIWFRNFMMSEHCSVAITDYTGWFRSSELVPWQWVRREKQLLLDHECKHCLRKLVGHTAIIGDSHARNTYFYLQSSLGGILLKNLTVIRLGNLVSLFSYTKAFHVVWLIEAKQSMRIIGKQPTQKKKGIEDDFQDAVIKWRSLVKKAVRKNRAVFLQFYHRDRHLGFNLS